MLSAIIPTYTNDQGLFKLVSQLKKIKDIEIIIVDNKPNDEKREKLKNFTYLPQQKNLGFAIAVNLASKKAKGDWLLILNDDIEFLPNKPSVIPGLTRNPLKNKNKDRNNSEIEKTIKNILSFAKKNHFDAVSPVLKKPTGEVENYGYKVLPIGRIQPITNYQSPTTKHHSPITNNEIDGLTAACLFIKKQVFEKIGGFDESFFAYLEDVDLFLRLKNKGYKFAINPNVFVIHNHMITSSKMGFFKEKQDFVNWIRVIIKNWGLKKIVLHLPGIIIERGRNLSGLIKKIIKVYFSK
jgi:GT2 family glycosyltransferase